MIHIRWHMLTSVSVYFTLYNVMNIEKLKDKIIEILVSLLRYLKLMWIKKLRKRQKFVYRCNKYTMEIYETSVEYMKKGYKIHKKRRPIRPIHRLFPALTMVYMIISCMYMILWIVARKISSTVDKIFY